MNCLLRRKPSSLKGVPRDCKKFRKSEIAIKSDQMEVPLVPYRENRWGEGVKGGAIPFHETIQI